MWRCNSCGCYNFHSMLVCANCGSAEDYVDSIKKIGGI